MTALLERFKIFVPKDYIALLAQIIVLIYQWQLCLELLHVL